MRDQESKPSAETMSSIENEAEKRVRPKKEHEVPRKKEEAPVDEGALMTTSHMTGLIQRIAYHLMFRPQSGKLSGKLPIQIASLAPSHSLHSIAGVIQSLVQIQPQMEAIKAEGPPRYILILAPTETYKFQALEMIEKAQISRHKSWTILTEDEFWCDLFPGYSNLMTPYIDITGCVVLPQGQAAQHFVQSAFIAPSPHSTLTWAHAIEQNAESHALKDSHHHERGNTGHSHSSSSKANSNPRGHHYTHYSAKELLWAILRPQTERDMDLRVPRLQHAVHALKATYLTDILPFNTSMETLSMLATLHELVGRFSADATVPNILSSYHSDIPSNTSKLPKRPLWTPNISFALDMLEYSNIQIPYLAPVLPPSSSSSSSPYASNRNSSSQSQWPVPSTSNQDWNWDWDWDWDWEERVLDHLSKTYDSKQKSVHYGFWEGTKANPRLVTRASFSDPFPMLHSQAKNNFRGIQQRESALNSLDGLFAPTAHLEMPRDSISEIVRPLLALASEANQARDAHALPLRILCQNNLDMISLMNTLEMQGIPCFSQNLFATPAVRILCDLFIILIELSKQSVLARARELEKEAQSQISSTAPSSPDSAPASDVPNRPRRRTTSPKSELHWETEKGTQVNLAAAFHSLLQGAYGFSTSGARKVESRIMYQFVKFKDPMMSLLLGIATNANYMSLDPAKARRRSNRHSTRDIVAEERHKMTSVEFEASVRLATEDAEMMISLLQSPTTPFRTKALAKEILRLQQALSQQEVKSRSQSQAHNTDSSETASSTSSNLSESTESTSSAPSSSGGSASISQKASGSDTGGSKAAVKKTHKFVRRRSLSTPNRSDPSKELTAEEMKDEVYSARTDPKASLGAKHLYQDLAYLISAIRAMPLSPSEIIDLFISRHLHRAEAAAKQASRSSRPISGGFKMSDESIVLMKAFSKSLKGLAHSPTGSGSDLSKSSPTDVLTEHYVSNADYLQKAIHFVQNAFVESPCESVRLATERSRALVTPGASGPAFRYPVLLNLDDFSHGSGDYWVTLRVLGDPQIPAQPHLLPPPAPFTAQLTLYGTQERLSADRGSGVQDNALRNEFELLKARRIMGSSLQYVFTTSKFPMPGLEYNQVPFKESYTTKTFLEKLESSWPTLSSSASPSIASITFEKHHINNPTEQELDSYFNLAGTQPTTPRIGSVLPPDSNPSAANQTLKTYNMLDPTVKYAKVLPLQYHHPAMELSREILAPEVNMAGPSFMFFGTHRPFEIGSTSIRVFRECQVLFALRYVWSVEPGRPASIHATTGMALHEAASKVHSQVLEKLTQALKVAEPSALVPPSPAPDAGESDPNVANSASEDIGDVLEAQTEAAAEESTEAGPVVAITDEDARVVHETLIESAFKQSIMSSQGLTELEADQLMAKPEYRRHVERAKERTLWQWEKEKEKQLEIGKKHKLKKEKERVEKEKLLVKKKKEKLLLDAILASKAAQPASSAVSSEDGVVSMAKEDAKIEVSGTSATTSSEASTASDDVIAAPSDVLGPLETPKEVVEVVTEATDKHSVEIEKPTDSWKVLPSMDEASNQQQQEEEEVGNVASLYSFSEQEFSFKLPSGHVWKGAWDRIDIDPESGAVEITEYKTSLRRNRITGLFQLQTYALAYWKVHHVIPSKLVLSSLSTSASEEYKPTKLDLIRTENLILASLQSMTSGLFMPTSRPALCISCHYSQQCPSALTASPLYQKPLSSPTTDATAASLLSSDPILKDLPLNQTSSSTSEGKSAPSAKIARHPNQSKPHHKKHHEKNQWQRSSSFHVPKGSSNPLSSL
jgi:CRISPR/Cas system-associated exonuclease Cas4 (RecB family)